MNNLPSVKIAADVIRSFWKKHGVKKDPLIFLGFCISLLPVPAIQQMGQALDRHLSDKKLEEDREKIWDQIKILNPAITKIENIENSII